MSLGHIRVQESGLIKVTNNLNLVLHIMK